MNFLIPKPNNLPIVTVQSAEPKIIETKQEESEDMPRNARERQYNSPFEVPIPMLPPGKSQEYFREKKKEEDENFRRLLKLGALATGIGLGILIAKKGYDFMWPVIDKTTEKIIEETNEYLESTGRNIRVE